MSGMPVMVSSVQRHGSRSQEQMADAMSSSCRKTPWSVGLKPVCPMSLLWILDAECHW